MPQPNPVWGVHVVEGAVTAALVRRTESGAYEILDAIAERAPSDAAEAVRHALSILRRRGVGARGAIVALPDSAGCLVTATIPPDELDLSEHEISNEMYEWTPFEPDQAELRHQCVLREGRKQERLVAAVPRAGYRRCLEVLETGDLSRLGVGLAGVATWRGARALGLVPPEAFLVATLPRTTEVYASPAGRVRRHTLAIGEEDVVRDATAIDVLASDLAQLADYHRTLRREGDKPPAEPRFALAGFSATAPAVRQRLAGVLGPRLLEGPSAEAIVTVAPKTKLPGVTVSCLAGAVGAALEALRPPEERLVLRHLPTDIPAYRDRSPLLFAGAAVIAAAAGGAAWWMSEHPTKPPLDTPRTNEASEPEDAPPTTTPSHPPSVTEVLARDPAPVTPKLGLDLLGPGRVRVRWPSGAGSRTLRRRFLGRDGGGPDQAAVDVTRIGSSAGEGVDDVPGPTGLYAWTVEGADEVRASIDVRVEVELLGPGEAGGARFSLRRPWRDGQATLAVEVAPGGRIAGTDAAMVFDSGLRLDAVRTRAETERAAVRVPRFLADGRVERGGNGNAVLGERVVERARHVFEADAVAPDGTTRTWSRKMTDG